MDRLQTFLDRHTELASLNSFLMEPSQGSPRCRFYDAPAASGLTSLLMQCHALTAKQAIVLFTDGANEVSHNLFFQIIWQLRTHYPKVFTDFIGLINQKFGPSRSSRVFQAALRGLPYAGPLFDEIASFHFKDTVMQFSSFPSVVAEFLCGFLHELACSCNIVIVIDNVQSVDSWSMDLLRTTGSGAYSGLRYIGGNVHRGIDGCDVQKHRLRFESMGFGVSVEPFNPPGADFAIRFVENHGRAIDEGLLATALTRAGGDIYKLQSLLYNYVKCGNLDTFPIARITALESEILGLLVAARQSIRKSDLLALCSDRPDLFIRDAHEFEESLNSLQTQGLLTVFAIPGSDSLVNLVAQGSPLVMQIQKDKSRLLLSMDQLYSFYSTVALAKEGRHSQAEIAPLLYRLSKVVDTARLTFWARRVLQLSLAVGSIDSAREFIADAVRSDAPDSILDYYLLIIFHISVREYRQALDLLNSPEKPSWARNRYHEVLTAICYNRTRLHRVADVQFEKLLQSSVSLEEQVILASFQISGRLHENDIAGARKIYADWEPCLTKASNAGYFLRNAASAFTPKEAISMHQRALGYFPPEEDMFGYYTTLNNMAAQECELHEWNEAYSALTEIAQRLQIFGVHHLHIVENNLGVCSIHLNLLDHAERHLRRSMMFSRSAMPSVYASLNYALLLALLGKWSECETMLNECRKPVELATFDRMKQKYYLNRALLEAYCGQPHDNVEHLVREANNHPDRDDPQILKRAMKPLKSYISHNCPLSRAQLLRTYSPCLLEYWYQSPNDLFPEGMLAPKAIGENMFN